jgi:hypothetical protein
VGLSLVVWWFGGLFGGGCIFLAPSEKEEKLPKYLNLVIFQSYKSFFSIKIWKWPKNQ